MTKSSKIIIALLVVILVAVLGIGVWLITDKSAGNGSVAITENTAGAANSETVTANTSVNNNPSNQSQQQNQNTNKTNGNNINTTQELDTSTDARKETIMLEGMEETITTSKYISSLGYSMRYDSDDYTVTSYNYAEGNDIYKCKSNPDIWFAVGGDFVTSYNEYINKRMSTAKLDSYEKTTINGYDAVYYKSTNFWDEGMEYYLIDINNGVGIFEICVNYPNTSEYNEGVGSRIKQMIQTFTINN